MIQILLFIIYHVSALKCIGKSDTILPSDSIQFTDANRWCQHHCDDEMNYQTHLRCAEYCNCIETERLLEERQLEQLHLMQCPNGNSLNLELPSSSKGCFNGFIEQYQGVYDNIITSLANDKFDAQEIVCQLSLLGNTNTSSYDTAAIVPTLVKVHESACVPQVVNAIQTNEQSVVYQQDDNLIVLFHMDSNDAKKIDDTVTCVDTVVQLPTIFKMAPLARSSRHFDTEMSSTSDLPKLTIGLESLCSQTAEDILNELNTEIQSKTGIVDALQYTGNKNSLDMKDQGSNVKTWAECLSIVVNHPLVLWVDSTAAVSSFSFSDASPFYLRQSRRLDDFISDVLKTSVGNQNGLNGDDIVVGVTDTGLYIDHDQFDQQSRSVFDRLDASARKVVLYDTFGDSVDQAETIVCGHGSHVAGIVAGSSFSGSAPDWGIAPNAKIAFKDIGTQSSGCAGNSGCTVDLRTPFDAESLFTSQREAGARVFSFSWGTLDSDYSRQAQDIDRYLFSNPDVIVVVAAGNSGTQGPSTISSPAGAKNVITVGASLNSGSSFSNNGCTGVLNEGSVAAFSSMGPTSDGRLKPDIVAPGQVITSSQSLQPGSTTKTSDSCSLQGTSQATPAVAGMAVMIYEWLRDGVWKNGNVDAEFGITDIPNSLVKALLIHSSESLQRRIGSTSSSCSTLSSSVSALSYPDNTQGYGLPQFSSLAMFDSEVSETEPFRNKVFFLPNSTSPIPSVDNKGTHRYNFTVNPGEILRVTIVWTDPAGSLTSSRFLQHDLDLTVQVPGFEKVYFPLSGNNDFDRVNNVEMVQISYDELASDIQLGASVNSSNSSEPIVVEATIFGFSVAGGSQAYSLVASSGSIGSTQIAGIDPSGGQFWRTWMTILVTVLGAVAIMFFVWFCCISKRRQQGGNYRVPRPAPYQSQQFGYAGQAQLNYVQMADARYPNQHIVMPVAPQNSGDQCPYCRFATPDPVELVGHVEAFHVPATQSFSTPATTNTWHGQPPTIQTGVPVSRATASSIVPAPTPAVAEPGRATVTTIAPPPTTTNPPAPNTRNTIANSTNSTLSTNTNTQLGTSI